MNERIKALELAIQYAKEIYGIKEPNHYKTEYGIIAIAEIFYKFIIKNKNTIEEYEEDTEYEENN